MMISLNIILIAYFIILTTFVIFALFNVYHALRFGLASVVNVTVLIIFLLGAISIIGIAMPTILKTDWNQIIFDINIGTAPTNNF